MARLTKDPLNNTDEVTLTAKAIKTFLGEPIVRDVTATIPIAITETPVPFATITVPTTGTYQGSLLLSVSKPSGGGTTIVTVRGFVNGVLPPTGLRTTSVTNDGTIRPLDLVFLGPLTAGQVITATVQANSTGTQLVTGTGYISARAVLTKIG